jgi:transcriptional regulator with XRE-family HTH domain
VGRDIILDIMSPAELIRTTRERHGISQRALALRGGTTQAVVSRIERGEVSPTWTTVTALMEAMGEEPRLTGGRHLSPADPVHLAAHAQRSPAERLELAISWNRLASELRAAGRAARRNG